MVKAFLFIFHYPSFEVHAYIYPPDNAYLSTRQEMLGNKTQLVCYLPVQELSVTKGWDRRRRDSLCESSLTSFGYFHIDSSEPQPAAEVDAQRKAIISNHGILKAASLNLS